jgi:RNA polymerase-binding transcription factor DksA
MAKKPPEWLQQMKDVFGEVKVTTQCFGCGDDIPFKEEDASPYCEACLEACRAITVNMTPSS